MMLQARILNLYFKPKYQLQTTGSGFTLDEESVLADSRIPGQLKVSQKSAGEGT